MKILVLQGPNLNLLGTREPSVYGTQTLLELQQQLDDWAPSGVTLVHAQHACEGALVSQVHRAAQLGMAGVLVNAGAYSHTSIALRDALVGTALPFVEVHISNTFARESFRHHSVLADQALGVVIGFGVQGYLLGLLGLLQRLGCALPQVG